MDNSITTILFQRRFCSEAMRCCRVFAGHLALLIISISTPLPGAADDVLLDGLAWRQLTDTAGAGLSWDDVASVCPLDETPCNGSVKGVDFTGWIWASRDRVYRLLDTLTGLEIPANAPYDDSPVELFFDKFDPVFEGEGGSVQLSMGISALPDPPADAMIDVIRIQDARVAAGSDAIDTNQIGTVDTEASGGFFGPQPLGVFLVRDPDLELCSNGIDDDGDGVVDIADQDCTAAGPVVNGLEWRQLTVTQGIDIYDVAAVCPAHGIPCNGSAGGVDFTGWTWAYSQEVQDLLVELTGHRVYAAAQYFSWDSDVVPPFFAKFAPTFRRDNYKALYGFTYDSGGEYDSRFPEDNPNADAQTCINQVDDDGDGKIDFDDADCLGTDWFLVRDSDDPTIFDTLDSPGGGVLSNPYYGFFLHRAPMVSTPEACDNTFDDDGDGLIDGEDVEDCGYFDRIGLQVRCMHDPVYVPESGKVVKIRAEALDGDGQPVQANSIEIWLDSDKSAPRLQASDTGSATLVFSPSDDFSYSCTAARTRGDEKTFSGWRTVAVGADDGDFPAIPILYNGSLDKKIDIVFFPDKDEYTSPADPEFIKDVGLLIKGGYYTVPWFVYFQDYFNFWIGKDFADAGPDPANPNPDPTDLCIRKAPDNFGSRYSFADSAAIVHQSACRDNAGSPGLFTVQTNLNRLQTVVHESGHRPFGMADEYCCDGGYFTRSLFGPPYPNLFKTESGCQNKGEKRGYDPTACRSLVEDDTGKDWWLFEADFRELEPRPRDVMQGTGWDCLFSSPDCQRTIEPTLTGSEEDPTGIYSCTMSLDTYVGDPDGVPNSGDETYWVCRTAGSSAEAEWIKTKGYFDRLDRGDSENDRLKWFLSECLAGRCG